MFIHKLVVVSSFNDYKKGDQIIDQNIVCQILDKSHPMNDHESKCRKVLMSEIEKQQYVPAVPENEMPKVENHVPNAESLKDIEVESSESINLKSVKPK